MSEEACSPRGQGGWVPRQNAANLHHGSFGRVVEYAPGHILHTTRLRNTVGRELKPASKVAGVVQALLLRQLKSENMVQVHVQRGRIQVSAQRLPQTKNYNK
jgi:hypothetical protein